MTKHEKLESLLEVARTWTLAEQEVATSAAKYRACDKSESDEKNLRSEAFRQYINALDEHKKALDELLKAARSVCTG